MHRLLNHSWRRENLYYIIDKKANKVLFKQNNIQKAVSQSTARVSMILKARQFGVSTEGLIDDLDFTMFNPNVTSVILAHEQDAIEKLFRIVRRAYEFVHPRVRPLLDRGQGSKYELYFPAINSRIYCDLESRGDTISRLHVSECAFMKKPERLKSTIQAVPFNGKVRIESTPNGIGNYFYELWADPENHADKMFFPWFLHDEYKIKTGPLAKTDEEMSLIVFAKTKYGIDISDEQIAFRRYKKQELKSYSDEDKVTFEQEYPENDVTCFVTSGNMVFDGLIIKRLLNEAPRPIRLENGIKFYEERNKEHRYIIGADVSEGGGGDYSTFCVLNVNTKRQVASFRGQIRNFDFADLLTFVAKEFSSSEKRPMIAVERNNHGHAVILELEHHKHYSNIYRAQDDKLGWHTTALTRPNLLNTFVQCMETETIKFVDKSLFEECLTLVNNKGKIEAAAGKHDDCVVAAAIASKLVLEQGDLDVYTNIKSKILI